MPLSRALHYRHAHWWAEGLWTVPPDAPVKKELEALDEITRRIAEVCDESEPGY